uniref:Peptidase M14 carboxypeptidase A domain-containing protein n=1 Tax=Romanomermis culicivorax TaxID=13658 RepID=A0A915KRH3_ROMCU
MPCCDQYSGPHPVSESEVHALSEYIKRKNVDAYISLHSYGQHWTYPYLYAKRRYPKNVADMHEIAETAVTEISNLHGINYTIGNDASGSSTDWVIDNSNASSWVFLVETRPHRGGGDFCLPEEELPAVNREILTGIEIVAKYLSGQLQLTDKYKEHFADKINSATAKFSTIGHFLAFISILVVAFLHNLRT